MDNGQECDDMNDEDILYFMRELTFGENKFKISQKYIGEVSCVVWDSAIVACHYFARHQPFWRGKKVLELGAGTGVCSIVLAALGANVVATDLSEGIELLNRNIRGNWEVIVRNKGSVKAEILDWDGRCDKSLSFDVIIMIDVIYYLKPLQGLVELLLRSETTAIICCYEVRDIGEPKIAQKRFLK
ncbi:hypothetical protein DINM_003556 [Dirofilaria immitis]|nr:hypothetical protein [Dirofilaria immitis]